MKKNLFNSLMFAFVFFLISGCSTTNTSSKQDDTKFSREQFKLGVVEKIVTQSSISTDLKDFKISQSYSKKYLDFRVSDNSVENVENVENFSSEYQNLYYISLADSFQKIVVFSKHLDSKIEENDLIMFYVEKDNLKIIIETYGQYTDNKYKYMKKAIDDIIK